jgi:hypothetical protein
VVGWSGGKVGGWEDIIRKYLREDYSTPMPISNRQSPHASPGNVVHAHNLTNQPLLARLLVAHNSHRQQDVVRHLVVVLGHLLGLLDGDPLRSERSVRGSGHDALEVEHSGEIGARGARCPQDVAGEHDQLDLNERRRNRCDLLLLCDASRGLDGLLLFDADFLAARESNF